MTPEEQRVIEAACAYRQAEQDGTPRLWRGKELHDLGVALDNALADLDAAQRGEAPAEQFVGAAPREPGTGWEISEQARKALERMP